MPHNQDTGLDYYELEKKELPRRLAKFRYMGFIRNLFF